MTARPMVIDAYRRIPRRTGSKAWLTGRRRAQRSDNKAHRTVWRSPHLRRIESKRTRSPEATMPVPTLDTIIDELRQLAARLDTLPDISDVDMALMYLRHLRRQRCEPVSQVA
jgi:hypothetical protein